MLTALLIILTITVVAIALDTIHYHLARRPSIYRNRGTNP